MPSHDDLALLIGQKRSVYGCIYYTTKAQATTFGHPTVYCILFEGDSRGRMKMAV